MKLEHLLRESMNRLIASWENLEQEDDLAEEPEECDDDFYEDENGFEEPITIGKTL